MPLQMQAQVKVLNAGNYFLGMEPGLLQCMISNIKELYIEIQPQKTLMQKVKQRKLHLDDMHSNESKL